MVLTGQLLGRKPQTGHNFPGKISSFFKSDGVKVDFRDHSVVWHHHGYRSEQGFKVIWKLRTTGITWVHCDETIASWLNWNVTIFKDESFNFLLNGVLNTLYLLSNDGQYLQLNSVELIKARPGTAR